MPNDPPGASGDPTPTTDPDQGKKDATAAEESAKSTERRADAQSRINEDLRIGIEREIRLKELEESRLKIIGQSLEAAKQRLQLQTSQLSKLEGLLETATSEKTTLEDMVNIGDKLKTQFDLVSDTLDKNSAAFKEFQRIQNSVNETQKEINDLDKNAPDFAQRKLDLENQIKQSYKEQAVEFQKLRADIQDVELFSRNIDSTFDKIGNSMGIQADMSRTTAGNFAKMSAELMSGLSADKFALIGKGLQQFATGAIFSFIDKIGEMAIQLDKIGKDLQASTGFTKNFNSQLMTVTAATTRFGGTMEDASEAVQALSSNFKAFNPEAEASNIAMAENIVLLQKFGVGSASSAKMIDQLSKSQGMSGESASQMTMEIVTAGRKIGISAEQMAQDFAATHDSLVQFGDDADEIFIGMAAQAKATGIEVSNLVNIAKGFDTFEGAADKVGKLNAIMGTSLSALDLMNADYEETINLLRQGTQNLDFDSMNRFEKQYLQTALGVSSVDEAQRLLTMSTSEYLSYQSEMENNAATQEQLAEAARKMVPIMQKLEIAFSELVVTMGPLVLSLLEFASGIVNLITYSPHLVAGLIAVGTVGFMAVTNGVLGLAAALYFVVGPMMGFVLLYYVMDYLKGLFPDFAGYLDIITIGFFALGVAIMFSVGNIYRLGIVLLTIFSLLGKTINPQFIHFGFFLALGILALGIASKVGGVQLIILALALGVMFGAVSLIFFALEALVNSLTSFFEMLVNNVESLPLVAAGLYMMAGAFAAMGIAAALSLGSVVLLLAALTGVGAIFVGGMMLMGFETLGALSGYMAQLGTGMEKFSTGLEKIKVVTSMLQQIGKDAFIAVSVKGDTTTAVIAPKDMIPDISNGIDINIKVNVPQPIVYVNIDGKDIPSEVDKARSTPSIFDKAIGNAMGAA